MKVLDCILGLHGRRSSSLLILLKEREKQTGKGLDSDVYGVINLATSEVR